jgi:hypothetical protein
MVQLAALKNSLAVPPIYLFICSAGDQTDGLAHALPLTYAPSSPQKFKYRSTALVAHTCNCYSEDRDQEDQGSKPALGK